MSGKLSLRWTEPYWIDKVIRDGTFMLRQFDGVRLPKAVNGYQLRSYFGTIPEYSSGSLLTNARVREMQNGESDAVRRRSFACTSAQ